MKYFYISLTKRYIPAIILIAMFVVITNILNTKSITANKSNGSIINISGKQRMLSQKILINAENFINSPTFPEKDYFLKTITEFKLNNEFILERLYTQKLKDIFFKEGFKEKIEKYIDGYRKIITNIDKEKLNELRIQSVYILKISDKIVKEYEKYAFLQLEKTNTNINRLTLFTLFILLLEVIFIFKPSSNKIEENKETLEKNLNLISKYVIYSKTDLNGIITEVSDAFCNITGYKKEEIIGEKHNIVRHNDMTKEVFENMWKTIQSGTIWEGEVKSKTKCCNEYWSYTIITPEYDIKNKKIGYMSIINNITDKKKLEEQSIQLIQSEKMASMGRMIGNIAHQWRQPLSAITSVASSVQLESSLGILSLEDTNKHMGKIKEKSLYLSETIETFRDFISDNKEFKEISVKEELLKGLDIIEFSLNANTIKLINNIDETYKTKIKMVEDELSQVIINIITNSQDILSEVKKGDPWIKIDMLENKKNIIITIEDNGGGIPDKVLPKIFDPYFTTKHETQGTGLGLHMSYQIIKDTFKGKLYAKNTKHGAKFFIELPKN